MDVNNPDATVDQGQSIALQEQHVAVAITTSPPSDPTSIARPSNGSSSDYPITGLDVLQAASDAAQALQDAQDQTPDLTSSAVAAVAAANAHVQDQAVTESASPTASLGMMVVDEAAAHDGNMLVASKLPLEMAHGHDHDGQALRDPSINPKRTRLSRACDGCSLRKVKCDATGPPCGPCRDLSIACTMQRPKKRRGPPNRSLEVLMASKKLRPADADELGSESAHLSPGFQMSPPSGHLGQDPQMAHSAEGPPLASPNSSQHHAPFSTAIISTSPKNAAQALVAIAANENEASLEDIAPLQVITALIDDYFTYLHPLIPFPHEPTFRHAFASREDRHRPEFLGLVASMVAAVVASYPRSLRQQLKISHGPSIPRGDVLIEACRRIVLDTRGSRWILKQPKTMDEAATSYLLGVSAGNLSQWNISQHFTTEALTLINELGFHGSRMHDAGSGFDHNGMATAAALPSNIIREQIGLRLFWSLLIGARYLTQVGGSRLDLIIPPPTPQFPYPAFPELVSDNQIQANEIIDGGGATTLMTGFRLIMDTYYTMNGIVSAELAYGIGTLGWSDQRNLLKEALLAAKGVVDRLPAELLVRWNEGEGEGIGSWDGAGPRSANGSRLPQAARRQLQFDIQKANFYGSQLSTRSYYVDLYFHLLGMHLAGRERMMEDGASEQVPVSDEEEEKAVYGLMVTERDQVVDELVSFICTVSPYVLEPNAGNLVSKLRHVAMTALAGSPERKGPTVKELEEVLMALVDVLNRLSRIGQAVEPQEEEDEEAALQAWADVRRRAGRFWEEKCKPDDEVPEVTSDAVDSAMEVT